MASVERIQTELQLDSEEENQIELPLGWRFVPTDQELIISYLTNKVFFRALPAKAIKEIDAMELYSVHPKVLVESISNEPEHYFFVRDHEYFYGEINKMKRVGDGIGYWRCIGKEDPVHDAEGNLRAFKIHSTYFSIIPKRMRTHWRLEVYRLVDIEPSTEDEEELHVGEWVVARITRGKDPRKQWF
ncbi:hypothetical protein CDL12_08839 [Handroanthus impetiginosus]|uniref:NAC domain-containing protein n=1 Tax=Handroanthus impetiginosus TaxID=429701 RepID=A0A2G9HLT7_9LAMI|nr:hypothetical protein CDL12_08839 [Handroanthus impetiginosus]